MEVIAKNQGMNKFLTRVYNTTGLSIIGALSASAVVINTPLLAASMSGLAIFGMIGTLGGFIGAQYMKPNYIT